jgi:hypothetical protein
MVNNTFCVLGDLSPEQAKESDDDLEELASRVESLRYQLVEKHAR